MGGIRRLRWFSFSLAIVAELFLVPANLSGAVTDGAAAHPYTRSEAMVPMRDGVRLHCVIFRPEKAAPGELLPILLNRTPYGAAQTDAQDINDEMPELAASGYLFVFEDVRGRYGSGGAFVMNRPLVAHDTPHDIDESTDAYDTVDWLVKNLGGNNGRVGIYGISYDGFLAAMAGIDPHPAVKAISPQAPMTDVWLGDDFFHNGAFRETYGFDYVQQMEGQKTDVRVESRQDTYDFFLAHINFAGAAAAAKMDKLPTARAFITQPAYTPFWQAMAVEPHLTRVAVPTLLIGGYWDQEDMWGTQAEYAALAPHDSSHQLFLVLGPWYHGSWLGNGSAIRTRWGTLDAGRATGDDLRRNVEAPFFEKYLKDRPGFTLASVASFRTGANQWEFYGAWPPSTGVTPATLYLEPGKRLSFDLPPSPKPQDSGAVASYVSDPDDPIPYRHRPIQSTYARDSQWYTWLAEDQRFATTRNDVAAFTMPRLDHDVTVSGDVMADIFASTTGSDADWVVKLIDVYPDSAPAPDSGYQLMVASEIFRGRYRQSFERPSPIRPGEIDEYKWSLHGVDHTFLKGHAIMVEVQSTWFPLYDRNPQTFVPDIMTAPKDAYKPETMTIYGSPEYPSHLDVDLAK
ncbi:MAG TPA: CocE/NonD family hydrolase [Acidobacteriaceae bacterium]|nr:CocE/NonD family hydrolase [Acidobacteriaceae bacterium]